MPLSKALLWLKEGASYTTPNRKIKIAKSNLETVLKKSTTSGINLYRGNEAFLEEINDDQDDQEKNPCETEEHDSRQAHNVEPIDNTYREEAPFEGEEHDSRRARNGVHVNNHEHEEAISKVEEYNSWEARDNKLVDYTN